MTLICSDHKLCFYVISYHVESGFLYFNQTITDISKFLSILIRKTISDEICQVWILEFLQQSNSWIEQ